MNHIEAPFIQLRDIYKSYHTATGAFVALKDITLQIQRAEFVAVIGKSGSGKSTLMNVLTGIDDIDRGEIVIDQTPVHRLDEQQKSAWRGKNVGVVFQFFQLLPTLSVLENVLLPMDFCASRPARERKAHALALLKKLDILEQADKLPSALSGGQQQRAAIARALANDPAILVADEPTGNLDSDTATGIIQLFAQLASEGKTIIMVTHEREYADYFSRTIHLRDGSVIEDSVANTHQRLSFPHAINSAGVNHA